MRTTEHSAEWYRGAYQLASRYAPMDVAMQINVQLVAAEARDAAKPSAAEQRKMGINPHWSGRADDSPRYEAGEPSAAEAERDAYKRQCDSLINDVIAEAETQMVRDARLKNEGAAEVWDQIAKIGGMVTEKAIRVTVEYAENQAAELRRKAEGK